MSTEPSLRRILVTGATGTLGRHVVAELSRRPDVVCRALSRHAPSLADRRPTDTPSKPQAPTADAPASAIEWREADLLSDPLEPLTEGADAIVHLASGKGAGDADVKAAARLLEAARTVTDPPVRHVVVISIIGCDRIPLPFYASKQRIEALVEAAALPTSIVRVAQFHSFVARLVATPAGLPLPFPMVGDLRFQPIDEAEAAAFLVDICLGPPLGRAPELAGPEVLTLAQAAALWFAAAGRPATLVPIPLGALASAHHETPDAPPLAPWALDTLAGYRAAWNTPHGERRLGAVTFAAWLARDHDGYRP